MSCNYADGLSSYDNKGVLGLPECFDSRDEVQKKCEELAELIKRSKHVVFHSGAGISTSAGIPDFRGPKGVWTLEEKGLKPDINVSFSDAIPTKTHMAIKKFIDEGYAHYVISQNIDGLHLKSGVLREHLAELHGNMFTDQCSICKRQFIRSTPSTTVGRKISEIQCKGKGRPCRGKLQDTILDWEDSLPDDDLELSDMHSSIADLSICLGTTLQIVPSGNIPLNTLRSGGKLVICNLQRTKHDNKADLIINTYVDDVMEQVAKLLGITIPTYNRNEDPTIKSLSNVLEWTIKKSQVTKIKTMHKSKCFGIPKKRILAKRPNEFKYSDKITKDIKKIKPNKKFKCEKKTKPEKNSKPIERRDDIIVIDENDSDNSDVVFIDEDMKGNDDKKSDNLQTIVEHKDICNLNNIQKEPILDNSEIVSRSAVKDFKTQNIDDNFIKNCIKGEGVKIEQINNITILKQDTLDNHGNKICKYDCQQNCDDYHDKHHSHTNKKHLEALEINGHNKNDIGSTKQEKIDEISHNELSEPLENSEILTLSKLSQSTVKSESHTDQDSDVILNLNPPKD